MLQVLKAGGESLLSLLEEPTTLTLAAGLLGLDENDDARVGRGGGVSELRIEAVGMGDTLTLDEMQLDGPQQGAQLHWHSDTGSKLAFRTAIDPQGAKSENAALRVLPGSHLRSYEEVAEEIDRLNPSTKGKVYSDHPAEVEVALDRASTLIWNPTTWHATGKQRTPTARRAFGWNYGVRQRGTRLRDVAALKYVFAGEWEQWPQERQRLWGLLDDLESMPRL